MAKVKIQGNASGTGVLTIAAPNTSTDRTITLPDATGTLLDENSSLPAANLTGTVADARISTLTASKLTGALPAISGASLTGLADSGITEADCWRITSNYGGGSGGQVFVTSNLARDTLTGFEKIGTGMTQSSGLFTFPSTGIWLIEWRFVVYNSNTSGYLDCGIKVTTDGGSNFSSHGADLGSIEAGRYTSLRAVCQFDVTNVSTHKVKFSHYISGSPSTATVQTPWSLMRFFKLGET